MAQNGSILSGQPRHVSSLTQFAALLHKNVLLLATSRGSLFKCFSGWGSFVFRLAVPAVFFTIMLLPKYYIPPIPQPRQLQPYAWHLHEYRWSDPSSSPPSSEVSYSGPLSNELKGAARILLAPDTPAVHALLPVLARALACGPDSVKNLCPPGWLGSFHCMFTNVTASAQHCLDQATCMEDPSCYTHLIESTQGQLPQLAIMHDEEAAVKRAMQRPAPSWRAEIDAVVVFKHAQSGRVDGLEGTDSDQHIGRTRGLSGEGGFSAGGGRTPARSLARTLLEYRIRINHTKMAPPFLLYDIFNVVPHRHYRKLFFFANLQLVIDRSILGLRRWELLSGFPKHTPSFLALRFLENTSAFSGSVSGVTISSRSSGSSSSSSSSSSDAWPADVRMSVKEFPWPAVEEDLGAASAGLLFILLMVFAFLAPTRAVVGSIVREKELGLREGMRIMGLGDLSYWGSWFLTHWILLFTSGTLCAIVAMFPFNHTSLGVMILFFALFTSSLVCFSFFLSTLFSTSRTAGTASQLLYTICMLPGILAPIISPFNALPLYWACLFPPSAAALFAGCLIKWEVSSHGITWATVALPSTDYSYWSAASVLWIMSLDCIIYAVLAWYCDKVLPTNHSITSHPLFFLNKANWFLASGRRKSDNSIQEGHFANSLDGESCVASGLVAACGRVGSFTRGSVLTQKLRKEYLTTQGGVKVALDDVDIHFMGGRITALLGHNGAGKSTLFNILAGVTQPSSGNAYLNGFCSRSEMRCIRESLGVCPQHDVLWPDLTVQEHLQLYASIKGKCTPEVVHAAGKQVGLDTKLNRRAGDLSGGERRKLSVAIAFLGNPDIVLIDEPTSSMDPYTRRFTWELIRSHRGRATIVFTTHSMEEAELLADDVVIMCAGRVVAQGAPMDLKAIHGAGYRLTLTLCSPKKTEGRIEALEALIQRYVPGTQLTCCKGSETHRSVELQFQLPRAAVPLFPCLLRELDAAVRATELATHSGMLSGLSSPVIACNKGAQCVEAIGVCSYGLSMTTLEEVFLKVTKVSRGESDSPQSEIRSEMATLLSQPQQQQQQQQHREHEQREQHLKHAGRLQGCALLQQQLHALLVKRALFASRGRLTLLVHVLVPVMLVWLILQAAALSRVYADEPAIPITRTVALKGQPGILSASPAVRSASDGRWAAWKLTYGQAYDSGCKGLYSGWRTKGTLEGWLLDHWYHGELQPHADAAFTAETHSGSSSSSSSNHANPVPAYDALHVVALPSPQEWLWGPSGITSSNRSSSSQIADVTNAPLQTSNSAAINLSTMVNQTAIWGLPAAISSANTGMLRYLEAAAQSSAATASGLSNAANEPEFKVFNHPLPAAPYEKTIRIGEDVTALLVVVCLTLAASVLSASFCVHLVRERASGSTHLQLLAGTPSWLYWACNLGWDLLQCSISAISILMLLHWYALPHFSGARLFPIASLLAGFGVSSLPLTYLVQRLYMDEMEALQHINTMFFLVGFLGFMAIFVIQFILIFAKAYYLEPWMLDFVHNLLLASFQLLSPHFCFAKGIFDVAQTYKGTVLPPATPGKSMDPWSYSVVGRPLAHMALQAFLCGGLVVFLDSGWAVWVRHVVSHRLVKLHSAAPRTTSCGISKHPRRTHTASRGVQEEEDGDVRAEMQAVQQGACVASGAVLVISGAKKAYGTGAAGIKAECTRLMRCLLHSLRQLVRRLRQRWGGGTGNAHLTDDTQESWSDLGGPVRVPVRSRVATVLSAGLDSSAVSMEGHMLGGRGAEAAVGDAAEVPVQEQAQAAERHGSDEDCHHDSGTAKDQDAVHALRGLWMHVMPGECFGLLGVNGAGKSTTFKILTGEVLPDEGDARIAGHSILLAPQQARKCLGYCPQADAHSGDMTGREVLSMYARLQGMHESQVGPSVESLLHQMGFDVSRGTHESCALQGRLQRGAASVSRAAFLLKLARAKLGWQDGHVSSRSNKRSGSDDGTGDACVLHGEDVEQAAGLLPGDAGSISADCAFELQALRKREPTTSCSEVPSIGDVARGRVDHASRRVQSSPGREASSSSFSTPIDQAQSIQGLTSADTRCWSYSGGSKRKLALAVALIGEPHLALLDEPSTGLDPGARRSMWSILQGPKVLKAGRGIVLTSHSMDECEALCNRLAIMSSGQARCIGSVQHLKNRFGGGYVLEARLLPPFGTHAASFEARVCQLVQQICSVCLHGEVVKNDGIRLEVTIPRGSSSLADLFQIMEEAVRQCCVASYSISQCTLGHVFLHLAGK